MNRGVAKFEDLCGYLGEWCFRFAARPNLQQTLHPSAGDHSLTDNIITIGSGRPFLTVTLPFQGHFVFPARPVCCQIAGKLKCSLILCLQHQKASPPLTELLPLKPKLSGDGAQPLNTAPLFSVIMSGSSRCCGLKPILRPASEMM